MPDDDWRGPTVGAVVSAARGRLPRWWRSAVVGPSGLPVRLAAALAILALFVAQSFYDHAADFKTFYSAGYAVRHPEIPLYDLIALDENPFGEVFKLPPPAAVYLVPFSFGTIQQARLVWRLTLVVTIVGAFAVLARALDLPLLGWRWLAGLALWCSFGPLQIAVGEGQWDPVFLLLVALATASAMARRPILAALAVALAASIKPYPLLLGGYFAARRAWRPAVVTAVALAALLLLGAAVVGPDETSAFVTRVLPASGATTAYADNQALGGVLARAWTTDLRPFPPRDAATLDLAIRLLALVLFGLTVWIVARRPADAPMARALQLGLFVPLSILVIPAAWTHYQAILLVPLTVLAVDQARSRPREPLGWLLLGAAFSILMLPNPTMLYGPEIDRGLWLRGRADAANLALQRLYPSGVSRQVLSYKTLGIVMVYALLAWRVSALGSLASRRTAAPAAARAGGAW